MLGVSVVALAAPSDPRVRQPCVLLVLTVLVLDWILEFSSCMLQLRLRMFVVLMVLAMLVVLGSSTAALTAHAAHS